MIFDNRFFWNRLVAFAGASPVIIFEFMRIARKSTLNYIASYWEGYDEGKYIASNFEAYKRGKKALEGFPYYRADTSVTFFNLHHLAMTSSIIIIPFIAILFRLGELYYRTYNSRYRNLAILVSCMMLPLYLCNIYYAEKHPEPYMKGYNDGYILSPPQFHLEENKGFQSLINITTLSIFLAMVLGSFMLGVAMRSYEQAERIQEELLSTRQVRSLRSHSPG